MGKILVSIGHHADAQGAKHKQLTEYTEATAWASIVLCHLGDIGIAVPPGTLRQKVAFINEHRIGASLAVELHFNAAVNSVGENVGDGCEALYYPGSELGKRYATHITEQLGEVLPPNRGAAVGWYRRNPDKGPNYFLSRTSMPAVIVEPEFVHNAGRIRKARCIAAVVLAECLIDIAGGLKA